MNAVLLALAIVSATPTIPDSTAFIKNMDAKWVTITDTSVETLSGKHAVMRLKMVRGDYCTMQEISDPSECADSWGRISPSEKIAADEIEVTNGRDYNGRFNQENYCAFSFRPQPYTPEMCDTLWNATIKDFSLRRKAAD
jgi:hypothetical protein